MQRTILVLALALGCAAAQAREVHMSCNIDSRYSLVAGDQAMIFTQADGRPGRVVMGDGAIAVDGHDVSLSSQDQARVRQFDAELRLLLPESQKVATAAIGIAFDALGEVAKALASHPRETLADLERSRAIALRELNSHPTFLFSHDDDAINAVIEPIVSRFVPEIAGGAVSLAFHAIFASDHERDAMEARMNRLEQTMDHEIDARSKALEPLADSMCQRLKRMDAIDNALDYRLPNGGRLELLSVDKQATAQTP